MLVGGGSVVLGAELGDSVASLHHVVLGDREDDPEEVLDVEAHPGEGEHRLLSNHTLNYLKVRLKPGESAWVHANLSH